MKPKMGIRAGQGLPKASVVANCNSNIRSGKAEKIPANLHQCLVFFLATATRWSITSFSLLCILYVDAVLFKPDPGLFRSFRKICVSQISRKKTSDLKEMFE
jgi:hypothetical protein